MSTRTLNIAQSYKKHLANIYRAVLPTRIIAITGSSAKSTTALLVAHLLSAENKVICQAGSNTLTSAIWAVRRMRPWHKFLVVEAGAGRPGDIGKIGGFLRPDVSVVTMVALEHKSAFKSIEAIQHEKSQLVATASPKGLVVLNADDPNVISMGSDSSARVVTFGQQCPNATYSLKLKESQLPRKIAFEIAWKDQSVAFDTRFAGRQFWLPVAAAAAVALELGVSPGVLAERMSTFEQRLERCGVLDIPGGPTFIVDTVKAPWHSMQLAFDLLSECEAPRKRFVLGHMSDFAGSDSKYRDAYRVARTLADEVLFVGDHAHRAKPSEEDIESGRFRSFRTPREVYNHIRSTTVPGEMIMLKGSSNLHLERIALGFSRDIQCWTPACGRMRPCLDCSSLYR